MHKIRRHLEAEALKLPEITKEFADYKEFKQRLDNAFNKATESFIEIGYYLRRAYENPEIIRESGYSNIYDLAKAEYGGIDKSTVSRFININERFSEGGFSDKLAEQYRGYGRSKLSVMLLLPDSINKELSTSFTRDEIEAIAAEYKEEQEITELEVLMEGEDQQQKDMENNLYKVLHQLGKEEPELFASLFNAIQDSPAAVQETFAPDGERVLFTRIMGVGKMMLSIKGLEKNITLTNVRSDEKEEYSWEYICCLLKKIMSAGESPKEAWEHTYNAEFPQKPEVAPVQPSPASLAPKKEPPKKESKVKKAKKPEPRPKEPEKEPEEQIPGQDDIMKHPEYLPEEMLKPAEILNGEASEVAAGEEIIENVTKQAEIVEKTPLEEPEKLINPECEPILTQPAAGMDTDEEYLEDIWDNMELNAAKLNLFIQDYKGNTASVAKERLKAAYQNAIDLAADLERILNHG
ncbi:MAG: hypothetical protein IJ379_05115 [Lachnospiraceae bacterium]|nr:hypothetical protein [Lachnospiraceae bacterium]